MATDATCVVSFANGYICTDLNSRVMIWDCVTPLETSTQKISMVNISDIYIMAKIETPRLVFKVSETSSNPNDLIFVFLPPRQLRTIHVFFTPSQKGTFSTNLVFSWYELGSFQVSCTDIVVLRGVSDRNLVDITSSDLSTAAGRSKQQLTFHYWYNRVSTFSAVVKCSHVGSEIRNPAFVFATFEPCKQLPVSGHLQITPNKLLLEPDEEINLCIRFEPSETALRFLRDQHSEGKLLPLGVLRFYTGRETVRRCLRKLGWPDDVAPWKRELTGEFRGEFYVFVNDAELTDERMTEAWSKVFELEIALLVECI